MPQKMAVLHLPLYTIIKREDRRGLHEMHWGQIRKVGESNEEGRREPLGLDKKMIDIPLLLAGCRIVNSQKST